MGVPHSPQWFLKILLTIKTWSIPLIQFVRLHQIIPGLIVLDYADLMVPSYQTEYRHQQNQIWKDLRGLNQELDCLLVTATQADADSYDRNSLRLKNFSEDKRKYGHVTTMYGLNQDSKGREKGIGLIRINELLLRDDGFDSSREVTILQSLSTGSPVVGSFF